MKITFLGTSHGIVEKNQFNSSLVISTQGKHYLIDAGAPITALLYNYDIPIEDVKGIFITHPHKDHYDGIVHFTWTINGFQRFENVRVPVYVSRTDVYTKLNKYLYDDEHHEGRISFHTYEEGVIFDDGTVKITAIPVEHMEKAFSFLVEVEGKRLVFTGDLAVNFPDYPKVITETECDLVVVEGAHTVLNTEKNLATLLASKTKHMVISHVYSGKNPAPVLDEVVEKLGKKFKTTLAYDGYVIEM